MIQDPAVVIGGSIAGLLSARVLAEHFSQVIVIEKDLLPAEPKPRRGTPQSVQPHTLFARGYRILCDLFPGIDAKLAQKGAISVDWVRDYYYYGPFGWSANAWRDDVPSSDIVSVSCSRPLLEWAIRQKVLEHSNIKIVPQYEVIGLLFNSQQERITGVRLHLVEKSSNKSSEADLLADLVVDASGRNSQSPAWLEQLGLDSPLKTVVNPFLSYATRRYREPKEFPENWKVLLVSQVPPHQTRAAYLAKIENGEWIATLGGYGKDRPPIDEKGFLEFARSLPHPAFYQAISKAEPVSPIYAYGATANRLRHFDRVKLPYGFIAVGDAVCSLCPVYGQGITTSALGAIALKNWLKDKRRLSRTFQSALARELYLPWTFATSQDLLFPTTQGERQPNGLAQLMQTYTEKLGKKAISDLSLHTLCTEVGQAIRSPLALYHPSVIIQAFF